MVKVLSVFVVLFLATGFSSAQPVFTSLHVFGDSASSTTDGPSTAYYYNRHRSNGRMWVEVLAQWQGLSFDATNDNHSYWEHYSWILTNDVNAYSAPGDVGTALFVVWVNNADMYTNIISSPEYIYDDSVLAFWTNANNRWISNHFAVISNLYSKGVRTLLMPNAVDLTKTPNFAPGLTSTERDWIRLRTIEFNNGFSTMLSNAVQSFTNLTIYSSDIFTLFDDVLSYPTNYGMINPGIGALNDDSLGDYSLNGPGADYVFWDHIHPTAKFQRLFAEAARELIWPMEIQSIASVDGTNWLSVVNVPIGRSEEEIGVADEEQGEVRGSTNLIDWSSILSFDRTNTTQTISVPVSGPMELYRLQVSSDWIWP